MITHVRSRRKNQISYDMLIVALKAYCDMVDAGFTENLARRSLSCILNIYATNPHVGQKYPVSGQPAASPNQNSSTSMEPRAPA